MWPKAIAQLIELLPHATRLLPMADRFFNAKTADAEASRNAMELMAEGLRGDLGQVTASHAGLYHQLNDQSAQLSNLTAELHTVKLSVEPIEARLARLEQRTALVFLSVGLALVVLSVICVLCSVTVYHLLHAAH